MSQTASLLLHENSEPGLSAIAPLTLGAAAPDPCPRTRGLRFSYPIGWWVYQSGSGCSASAAIAALSFRIVLRAHVSPGSVPVPAFTCTFGVVVIRVSRIDGQAAELHADVCGSAGSLGLSPVRALCGSSMAVPGSAVGSLDGWPRPAPREALAAALARARALRSDRGPPRAPSLVEAVPAFVAVGRRRSRPVRRSLPASRHRWRARD